MNERNKDRMIQNDRTLIFCSRNKRTAWVKAVDKKRKNERERTKNTFWDQRSWDNYPTPINNIRHDLKFDYKALRHGQVLTQRQVEARLAFCRDNVDQDWSAVMFTDESRVSTSPDSPVMWWVKRGQHVYVESHKFPPSIMIWAGIIGPMKTPLIKCPQRLNAQAYVEMLEARGVHNFMHWCGDTSIFQQDGAPCHTAASSLRWFRDQGVRVLPNWPANSPDLSPVEQIRAIMKRYILQRLGCGRP